MSIQSQVISSMRWLVQILVILLLAGLLVAVPEPSRADPRWISGTVTDAGTGDPVSGAMVAADGWAVLTDRRGFFRLPHLGEWYSVRAPGYRKVDRAVEQGGEIALQPFRPKALYLSFFGIGEPLLCNPALDLIQKTPLNALVIDIKGDRGTIPFASEVPLAKRIGAQKIRTIRDLPRLMAELKAKDIYLIARIVTFKDSKLAEAFPEWGIRDPGGELFRDKEGLAWVDPFRPEVWDYNIAIAEEAAAYGFDEIQFDYVRFPDRNGLRFADEPLPEKRVRAIKNFLGKARERLQRHNVPVAADIFGYSCWDPTDTSIGQRIEDLAPMVDTLAPMLYPSGFENGIGCYQNPVAAPYKIVLLSLQKARERTGLSPLRFRPWLQSFRDYAFDRRRFGAEEIREQVRAAEDFGSDGWMLWNAANVYSRTAIYPPATCQAEKEKQDVLPEPAGGPKPGSSGSSEKGDSERIRENPLPEGGAKNSREKG